MVLLREGKTKDVYKLENGRIKLKYKDTTTTGDDGKLDPGGNNIGGKIDGLGSSSLRLSTYFFKKFEEAGLLTHYIESDFTENTMTVGSAEPILFDAQLEVICRLKATGSFMRRYGSICTEGQDFDDDDYIIELCLKDDERGDPFITIEILEGLGYGLPDEELYDYTERATKIIKDDLEKRGLTLYDLKFEFGWLHDDDDPTTFHLGIIDEISWGIMRVYKDGKWLQPFELEKYFEGDI